jgi:hypothetical protein
MVKNFNKSETYISNLKVRVRYPLKRDLEDNLKLREKLIYLDRGRNTLWKRFRED